MKPTVRLTGEDGNVFALIGKVAGALTKAKKHKERAEFYDAVRKAGSYSEALSIMAEFVDIV